MRQPCVSPPLGCEACWTSIGGLTSPARCAAPTLFLHTRPTPPPTQDIDSNNIVRYNPYIVHQETKPKRQQHQWKT